MRSLLVMLATAAAVAACARQEATPTTVQAVANGDLSVRQLEHGANQEPRFEIVSSGLGRLDVIMEPQRVSMSVPVSTPPERYILRVIRQTYDGDAVLDQFVAPLFGAAAAEQLRELRLGVVDQQLISTTLELTNLATGSIVTTERIVTRLPRPLGLSQEAIRPQPASTSDAGIRLAAWLHLPRSSRSAGGIGPDGPVIEVDGQRVTIEEAGAVFEELRIELGSEPLVAAGPRP